MNFMHLESDQKLRGGYYTPRDLADYISKWVLEIRPSRILEPSCGDGVFIASIAELSNNDHLEVTGVEIEPAEAAKSRRAARKMKHGTATIENKEFLSWALEHIDRKDQYDAVIGNPPFIRYQYLPEEVQGFSARIFAKYDLDFTKHTNAWVPFIIASMALLRPGGRIGMVIPSEVLHVMHAHSLRQFLGRECSRLMIIDPEEIWFENTLQGAVILLCEKAESADEHRQGLAIVPVTGRGFLSKSASGLMSSSSYINGLTITGKWTYALLSKSELGLLSEVRQDARIMPFKSVAKVDVGIVTGANKFFLISQDEAKRHKVERWSKPMFGRSGHCPGVIYDQQQHQDNEAGGLPSNFIHFDVDALSGLDANARKYVAMGEEQGLHKRFKCRVRSPWYRVPSVYATKIGMLKRSHDMPRLIFNEAEAYTTDTAYRITSQTVSAEKLVYLFVNSLTALTAELEGRHYGGGVLELVPSEIEKLLLPVGAECGYDLKSLDELVRKAPMSEVIKQQDRKILSKIGLSVSQQDTLNSAWWKMRNRRQRVAQAAASAGSGPEVEDA